MKNTHGGADYLRELQLWFGDTQVPSIVSGCSPIVPASGLTFASFSCKAYVATTNEGLRYVDEAGTSVGPLNQGNGTYWLAIHKDASTGVAGWTRQSGTGYLWTKNDNRPAPPSQALIFAQVTVTGGAITAVVDQVRPAVGWVENQITGRRLDNPKGPIVMFVNTATPTGPAAGVWHTFRTEDFGMPYDVTSVDLGGILIITHGTSAETCDVTVAARALGDTMSPLNYIFQTVETQHPQLVSTPSGTDTVPPGGQRTPSFAVVPVRDGAFELQWNALPSPFLGQYPLHCSFGVNLALQGYSRPGIPAGTVGASGGGGGGHLIQDEGTDLTAMPNLNFVGAGVLCGTDTPNQATVCTITGGGGGSALVLDLGDNGVNESASVEEIATIGDSAGVVTEPTPNKVLMNFGLLVTQAQLTTHTGTTSAVHGSTVTNSPNTIVQRDASGNFSAGTITAALTGNVSGTATSLAANGANCTAGSSPLGVDASGAAEGCFDVATQTELGVHEALTNPHSATATNTASRIVLRDASGNFAAGTITASLAGDVTGNVTGTATALAANAANCTAGNAPLGVDTAGAAEGCFDVATQTEFDAHGALTNPHSATATNTANRLVLRDGSGNFSAGTITAALTGNATTSSALAANGANCSAGSSPLGVDTAGAVEGCFDVATQTELAAHEALTTAHSSTSANTASRIVQRDASGNFSAGTITATLAGNASTSTALAANGTNCGAGEAAAGVDASGNAEGCTTVGGGGGTPVVLDLDDNGVNESTDLAEIAVVGDTNAIFTEPSANKLLINAANDWPKADLADAATALAANGGNCTAGSAPLGVDTLGAVEGCFDVATQTELTTHENLTSAHSATSANTASRIVLRDASGNFNAGTITASLTGDVTGSVSGTASALAANGSNCTAGEATLGVDASGIAEGCFNVATQAELDTHEALTSTHGATSANTANRIVLRDVSGNFSAGTITAALTGNASTSTALAANGTNCGAGEAAAGVDASGNAEGCTNVGGGSGTSVALDLGDNGSNESTALVEIAIVGDTNSIFTEPAADKLLINAGLPWPTSTALAANGANCSAGSSPLGVDALGAVEGCFDVATQAELDTHANLTNPHSATSTNTASRLVLRDASGNFSAGTITAALAGNASTSTALAANGGNCSAGNAPLGVDTLGAVESCFDVATQTELDAGLLARAVIVGTPVATRIAEWTSATGIQAVTTTGTGSVVRQDNPSLNNANLGTPTAINLQFATGLTLAQMPAAVRAAVAVNFANLGGS